MNPNRIECQDMVKYRFWNLALKKKLDHLKIYKKMPKNLIYAIIKKLEFNNICQIMRMPKDYIHYINPNTCRNKYFIISTVI